MASNEDRIALLEATVRKLHAERKTLHEMLTEAGIPSDVLGDGVRTCLIGRVGVALDRLGRHDHRPLHRCPAQGCWRS